MEVLFLGCLFNEKEEEALMRKSRIGLPAAVNIFQWNLIKGLERNLSRPVDIVNVLPVGTYPRYFKDALLPGERWTHSEGAKDLEIGCINLPVLKQAMRAIASERAVRRWLSTVNGDKKSIIVYSTYLPFLYAVRHVPDGVNVTLVVTDLPEFYDLASSNSRIKKLLRTINNKLIYALLKRIDSFVILTEQMRKPLNVGKKPYIVVEGLVDVERCADYGAGSSDKKTVLYTGTLNFVYGIMNLINGFSLIRGENYELWICGSGEAEKTIVDASKRDSRIRYFGFVSQKEIRKLQRRATVLINPRTNDEEYTKYSFPSKTMEYMLSGRPVLMYKLEGMPDEYDPCLYYIGGNQPSDVANSIVEICKKPKAELDEFGRKAREFVIEKRNCAVQGKRIIELIETING
ncbi:Glycosyl transferases group 1 [Acididesulfobacillus acetoxydans]|uniref:Glycosyl transferase group 1 n=1 Tax=Acididesulfobacillus acetoxydans TaxID=1561005 RepID=A0A8S0WA54_9FIRM|nr:glycosyltransferase family 4 protein [Acididesulfobacillus acetoxydans]CAA7603149.1 Glycosyl transferases group 1 [Acididesulfobacillus acetoxydans]CEJ07623.1 Glycosyl transferase group 1 [Acididesulfobacillus acetoxydans]